MLVSSDGGLRELRLNRPSSLNAWTPQLGRELLAAVREASEDPAVRAILITGEGRAFSSGADLTVPRELTADGVPDLSSRLRVVPDEQLHAAAAELGARMAAGPTVALWNMKRVLRDSAHGALAEIAELEATLQQQQAYTVDYSEGVAAFKERRTPGFTGA